MSTTSSHSQITHRPDLAGHALADAARVLAVRTQLDELALAVLAGSGLAQQPAAELRQLLGSASYAQACRAWQRLEPTQ